MNPFTLIFNALYLVYVLCAIALVVALLLGVRRVVSDVRKGLRRR